MSGARAGWLVWVGVLCLSWPGGAGAQTPDAGTPPPADAGALPPAGPPPGQDEGASETDPSPSGTAPSGTAAQTTPSATPPPAQTHTPQQAARTEPSRAPRRQPAARRQPPPEEEEEEEDRFRFAYLEVSAGYSWINLGVIKQDADFVPTVQKVSGNGFALGGGAGFFISFVTLGLQAEWANHDGFDVGTVALDVGIRIPTPFIEPYLRAGVGYAWLFNLDGTDEDGNPIWIDTPSIRGVCVDVGLGFDFTISHLFAVGIGVDVAAFNVSRSGGDVADPGAVDLSSDGDAVGIQVSALAQLNLHF